MKLTPLLSCLFLLLFSCTQNVEQAEVTFIELGSVNCIPCQEMQAVMQKVKEKYPTKVKTIFYDVWTEEGKEAAKAYEFNLIPTQLFLDKNGKEYARHEGYFEFEELEKILKQNLN